MAYTITGEKCGTVRLDAEKTGVVVTESVQRSSKVTSNPVEKGSDINDHVINDPVVFSITGVFLDEDQSDILISIHALREEGDRVRFLRKECGKKKMWLSIPGAPGSLTAL